MKKYLDFILIKIVLVIVIYIPLWDEEIIVDKLKENNLELLTYNLVGRPIQTISKNITNHSFADIFNYNMDYLQTLIFEKLIIDITLDKLNKNLIMLCIQNMVIIIKKKIL